ncbi:MULTISPECIES: hypothetical protein [unclassified Nocardiopsis]|uniref:hypothetical protein n=1 Tax=Nocardiopsis TaxID=2013 RepID=UPI00387B299E
MTTLSVHRWGDPAAGPVAVLTCGLGLVRDFWLYEYAPEVLDTEARRYPALSAPARGLGGNVRTIPVPIPLDCSDGFNEAYYGRPERLLEEGARLSCSAWSFVGGEVERRFVEHLSRDPADGAWARWHGRLRELPELVGSLVLVVAEPG